MVQRAGTWEAGKGKVGLGKVLMGPEKAFSLGGKPGEASWRGMIGWNGAPEVKMMHEVCKSSIPKAKKRLSSVAYGLGRNSAPVAFFLPLSSFFVVVPPFSPKPRPLSAWLGVA